MTFTRVAISLLVVMGIAVSAMQAAVVEQRFIPIDSGATWVSGYWGYNAPKLAFDGKSFYTVGLWGAKYEDSVGTIYKITDGKVEKGIKIPGISQPPMVMIDTQGRLVVAVARVGKAPLLLHAKAAGEIHQFDELSLPPHIDSGRYMGAAIHGNRVIMAFLQGEDSDFTLLVRDLSSSEWHHKAVLQPGQMKTVPYTAWVYPVIVPTDKGVHVLITSADTSHSYNKVMYFFGTYEQTTPLQTELLAEVPPDAGKVVFGQSMRVSDDGTINAVLLYQPAHTVGLHAFRRDPVTFEWSDTFLKPTPVGLQPGDEDFVRTGIVKAGNATLGSVGSLFEDPSGNLWITATAGNGLDLFRSADKGRTWERMEATPEEPVDLRYAYFLHGIHPGSGGTMPREPHVVFSSTVQDGYQLWLAKMMTNTQGLQ